MEKLSPHLKEKAAFTETPRDQRFAMRHPPDGLLPRVRAGWKRYWAIAKVHVHRGYS